MAQWMIEEAKNKTKKQRRARRTFQNGRERQLRRKNQREKNEVK